MRFWQRLRGADAWLTALTVVLVFCALWNLDRRAEYKPPYDGVAWTDADGVVRASKVEAEGPGERAGVKIGDQLLRINDRKIDRAAEAYALLDRLGAWDRALYQVQRDRTPLAIEIILTEAPRRTTISVFQWVVGAAYLGVGLFILYRKPRHRLARTFFAFCLSSFVLYAFRYTGELNGFDRFIYWADVWATALTPALFVHFCMAFPRGQLPGVRRWAVAGVYALAFGLIGLAHLAAGGWLHTDMALAVLREDLDRTSYGVLGVEMLVGALWLRWGVAPADPAERQQRRWLGYGALWGVAPFVAFYVGPYVAGQIPGPNHTISVFGLAFIPLAFVASMARHRLMDVEVAVRRGAAYSLATAVILAAFYAKAASLSSIVRVDLGGLGPAAWVASVVLAALVFQPLKNKIQSFIDRRYYRERYDYRQTLADFAAELAAETDPDRMLDAVRDRLQQTLAVERLALFVNGDRGLRTARTVGFDCPPHLDLSFLRSESLDARGWLFIEDASNPIQEEPSQRASIASLDLNYYVACRAQGRTAAWIGLGPTLDGNYLTSEDLALVRAMSGSFAIALENGRLYRSLATKASEYQRLKDYNENIVESLHVGILAIDLDDRVESWNTQLELVFGISRRDAVGRPLDELLPSVVVDEYAKARHESGIHNAYKLNVRAQDFPAEFRPAPESPQAVGERIIDMAVAPLVAKNFEPIGRLLILDDVTDRVALEDRIVQTDKLSSIGLLAAGVAHEVNTPLAVISSYAQMLAKRVGEDPAQVKALEKITQQTFRASEIVNSLLNFSRTASHDFAPVDLNEALVETLSLVEPQLRKARVEVVTDLDGGLPEVRGVAGRLQQVCLNLFLNARDAMPDGGVLRVTTRLERDGDGDGERIRVEVADTGVGIPREQLSRIFDPFYTTKGPKRGTGLGLSISYGIIEEHNGQLSAHSAQGEGTTFVIELPVVRQPVHA
ncbi:MAG: PAS domain-containing protein [Acidobacteria bacterium]|nr:PAS domain-containing protein [Acidobacteriota bacterium]